MSFRGMEQLYYKLCNEFFTSLCLQYNQDVFSGELQVWMEEWHGYQHGIIFSLWGDLRRQNVLGNLKPSDKKLGLWRIPTWVFFVNICMVFPSCFVIPTIASNKHVLDWNFWPTGALLHRSLNWPLEEASAYPLARSALTKKSIENNMVKKMAKIDCCHLFCTFSISHCVLSFLFH